MTIRTDLCTRICESIDEHREQIIEVAKQIHSNPELGYEEHMASNLVAEKLRELGYDVKMPVGGLETAMRASKAGTDPGPTVAVTIEYDALPGLGHGCGHNLIAASGIASAIGMNAVLDRVGGTFQVIGTPAEEGGGGKIYMIEAGVFDNIDAALMIHHGGDRTGAPTHFPEGTTLAVAHLDLEYFGQTAHAGADPHNGRNALNAVIRFFTGVDGLRQHVPMSTRMHGIITHGGDAPNVVPGYASAKYAIRSDSGESLKELIDQVKRIAEGAALMTGTEVRITEYPAYLDQRPSYIIGRKFQANMSEVGLNPTPKERGYHSTDSGNVSQIIPQATGSFAISQDPIPGHSREVVDASVSPFGFEQFLRASKAMTLTVLDLLIDPEIVRQAKEERKQWPPDTAVI